MFDNSKVKCLTISYAPCSFMLAMSSGETLELKNGSIITGKQILIAAKETQVKIGADSSLFASGQSISLAGTQKNGLGASFIGQSGFCGF